MQQASFIEPVTAVHSAITDAMLTVPLRIECGFTRGFSGLQILGNTSEVCRDGKERARSALERLGIHIPARRVVVSLTPADIKKDGSHLDLPIAVSLALLLQQTEPNALRALALDPSHYLFAAELGLAGELRPVKGVVSYALAALSKGLGGIVIAEENLPELQVLIQRLEETQSARPLLRVFAFSNLGAVLQWLGGGGSAVSLERSTECSSLPAVIVEPSYGLNFDDMRLPPILERAALVVAAGMHSLLLRGSPGTGKSMFAARLTSILPPLPRSAHIESMRIHSSCSEHLSPSLLAGRPPFRAPHHQASAVAIMGSDEHPGEISLAHGGILFLDELPEFRRDVLEALREPLETGEVKVSRSRRKLTWQSRIILLAACNNCPCGWSGSHRKACRCGASKLLAYRQRLSGPLLSRIDLHVNVPEMDAVSSQMFVNLAQAGSISRPGLETGEAAMPTTQRLRLLVEQARSFAQRRNASFGVDYNRDLQAQHLLAASGLSAEAFRALLDELIPRTSSSRTVIRSLRIARTLADLDASVSIRASDLEQAWRWQADVAALERGEEIIA